jgi:hypothetical protein
MSEVPLYLVGLRTCTSWAGLKGPTRVLWVQLVLSGTHRNFGHALSWGPLAGLCLGA